MFQRLHEYSKSGIIVRKLKKAEKAAPNLDLKWTLILLNKQTIYFLFNALLTSHIFNIVETIQLSKFAICAFFGIFTTLVFLEFVHFKFKFYLFTYKVKIYAQYNQRILNKIESTLTKFLWGERAYNRGSEYIFFESLD